MKRSNTLLLKSMVLAMLFVGYANVSIAQIFWSEDFTNGIPTDWTNEDLSGQDVIWTWCDDPLAGAGGGSTGGCNTIFDDATNMQSPFAAETAATGYVTLDSDANNGGTANPHLSELTTSAIDCSGQTEVYLAFSTHIGVYDLDADLNAILQVSTDGGTTWEDYTLFPGLNTGERWSDNPEEAVVNLTAQCAGQAQVLLKWNWTAGWEYFWSIDDVIMTSENPIDPNDMRVNSNFFAIAPNSMIPASQVETFGFLADIENIGSVDQTGVELNVQIIDDAAPGTALYDETFVYGDVLTGELIENQLFPDDGFTPSTTPASYTGTYEITADLTDMDPSDNTRTFGFSVNDEGIWAKDTGIDNAGAFRPADANWEGTSEPFSWAWGNFFHVVNGGMYANQASFALGNPEEIVGESFTVKLYSWDDSMASGGNGDFNADPNERSWVGFATYTVQNNDAQGEIITVDLVDLFTEDPGVLLEEGVDYILMLEYTATDQTETFIMSTQNLDYGAQIFRSQELGIARYGAMLGVSEPLSAEPYSYVGFGTDAVPVVRMHIASEPININVNSVLDDNNTVNVYPSPANDMINVDIDLVEIHDEVTVEVVDAAGKLMLQRSYNDFQQDLLNFDLSKMAVGNYFLNVTTPEGQKTTKFSIQR